jgi:hypothetical protein
MGKLVPSPRRQLELGIPVSQTDQIALQIEELLCHEVHDLPFP